MALAIGITRTELNAAGLRREAGRSRDASAARRMLALALVLEGKSRTEADDGKDSVHAFTQAWP